MRSYNSQFYLTDSSVFEQYIGSIYWATVTSLTVGYGDIYPITAAGRLIAVFTMLIGVSTLAVVTARIAQFLLKDDSSK